MPESFECCGVRIDALPPARAATAVVDGARAHILGAVHLCNAYTLSLALRDERYAALLNSSSLRLPDGKPLVWVAKSRRVALPDRVYGPDLLLDVARAGQSIGLRHYFYGGTEEILDSFLDRLRREAPDIVVAGFEAPPFRPATEAELDALARRVVASDIDVVWVGLGTPKQDDFVNAFAARSGRTCIAVGAAYDFLSGAKKQAPHWMQQRGLEWLFRLVSEPRRLWRRYLIGNTLFVYGVARDAFRGGRRHR
jgi:N-acetylglucosaminyldiphosphoundecaprenol N-acetyl-beta-D-mannosaminyltransferase